MAAKDAFIENGFGNTSMDDIARRAGTTKRTVYNNFGSKERLLEAVIDHSILLFETAVPPLGPEADPEQIRDFCEILLQSMTWRRLRASARSSTYGFTLMRHLARSPCCRRRCDPCSRAWSAPIS